jgi:hypothetical protein
MPEPCAFPFGELGCTLNPFETIPSNISIELGLLYIQW